MKTLYEILGWPYLVLATTDILSALFVFVYFYTHGHSLWFCFPVSSLVGMISGFPMLYFLRKQFARKIESKAKLKAVK